MPASSAPGQNHSAAMALMVVAMLLLPGIDAIAKWLSHAVPATQIAWSRFAVQTLCLMPFALQISGYLQVQDMLLHALRGILLAVTTVVFFTALAFLPMADAIGIFFVEPLILTILAKFVLYEDVGWRRAVAVVIGLCGALLVIQPGYSSFGWATLLPIIAAIAFAVYLLLTRKLALRDDPMRMQFLSGVAGVVFMSAVLAFGQLSSLSALHPVWPSLGEWGLLILLGLVATFGHLLVVHAFKRAPAGLLAPFQYLEIVSATVLGFVLFDDFPSPMTFCGIAIIVGAGLYVFHRERVRSRQV